MLTVKMVAHTQDVVVPVVVSRLSQIKLQVLVLLEPMVDRLLLLIAILADFKLPVVVVELP